MNDRCEKCGELSHVHLTGGESGRPGEDLCFKCYNARCAEILEVDFEHPDFAGFSLFDIDGVERRFELTTQLLGDRYIVRANEVDKDFLGFSAAAIAETGSDPMDAFVVIYRRLRRQVGRRDLEVNSLGRLGVADCTVRGRFTWDEDAPGRQPAVVVDGQQVSWSELGAALESFEGFQFRLEILESTDDVDGPES